ncbi:MAG: redoxin domain-containing protein [Bacteroidaceae bacterium]|nr:redoxin domain-containing protein [Bacteroidaceae bacterium]
MKKSILFVMSMVLLASCTNKSFKVNGEAPEEAKYVYYTYNFFDEDPKLDSVEVADGKYVIEGVNEGDPVFVTGATDQNVQFWFVSEPGEIQISKEGMPSGTPLNDAIKGFLEKANEVQTEAELDALIDTFMKEHPNDLAGAFCLYLLNDYIGLNNLQERLDTCGDVVNDAIHKIIPQEKFDKAAKTAAGQMFTDFEAEYEGTVQKLSDYVGKGKYVLVDFWASWCGPCRREIPTVIELYDKYAGDNFEVLGVATWDKPEDTKQAMEELGIKYPQIMNAQKAGSDAYNIEGIPEIILFAPDGTIVKRGLRGEAMVKAVEDALGK